LGKHERGDLRLDRYLSESTPFRRSEVRGLLRQKRITVNGKIPSAPDFRVTLADEIAVDGVPVRYRKYVYLMLNKPQGYLSATEDKFDPVVVEFVPEELKHFAPFPVGRLDKDTEGLLLLTNDGRFDHALTSPKKEIVKRYFAELDKPAEREDVAAFASGMTFKDFTAKPAKISWSDSPREVTIEISEGKFHQVKRMCERVGKTVLFLKRCAIGNLELDVSLKPGEVRELTDEEVTRLIPEITEPGL